MEAKEKREVPRDTYLPEAHPANLSTLLLFLLPIQLPQFSRHFIAVKAHFLRPLCNNCQAVWNKPFPKTLSQKLSAYEPRHYW